MRDTGTHQGGTRRGQEVRSKGRLDFLGATPDIPAPSYFGFSILDFRLLEQESKNRFQIIFSLVGVSPAFYFCAMRLALCALLSHLTTSFARASTSGGIVRPICFAALRLMTNSNFVACCTGRSAGFVPLRIFSTYQAARR
jgi:hypothetical protein